MDALSTVLSSIRLDGAVYFNAEFTAPWCAQANYGTPEAQLQRIGADHIVFFHCVTHGQCVARIGAAGEEQSLTRGDLVMFPHDAHHLLGSDLSLPPFDATLDHPRIPDDVVHLHRGGGGAPTRFVCGYLACNRRVSRSMLTALPDMLSVSLLDEGGGSWLLDMLDLGVRESMAGRPGAQSVLTKLSELLFTEALRRYCDRLPASGAGWLSGLKDPLVGRVLALMHRHPARGWTVADLARASVTSRSVLGERFKRIIGVAPMQYLASHRLALAAQALRSSDRPISEIAEKVGYGSEAAFTRAFKREYGTAPGLWRLVAA